MVAEQAAVMRAITTGDVDGARAAIADHLARSGERVLAQLQSGDRR